MPLLLVVLCLVIAPGRSSESPAASPPVRTCESWCAGNANPWSEKCSTYKACLGCNECLPDISADLVVDCGAGGAGKFEAALNTLRPDSTVPQRILISPSAPCTISASRTINSGDEGLEIACWENGAYCTGGKRAQLESGQALSGRGVAALTFTNCHNFYAHEVHFTGLSVKHTTQGGDGIVVKNTTYENCVFEKSPVTSLNFYFFQTTTAKKAFDGITVTGCAFFEMGYAGVTIISWPKGGDSDANRFAFAYTRNVVLTDNVFYNAYTAATDAAGTTPLKAPGVILNRVWHMRAQRNTFIRMAGSGLWSTQTYDLLFSHNVVAYSRRITDACTNHVDIQNDDSIFEYNVGYKNEGGFFESMGLSDNNVVRYCVSVDDGQEDLGDGLRTHHANTIFLTGYAGKGNTPVGPTNITLHNNLVVSTNATTQYYRFINEPQGILLANNEFVVGAGAIEALATVGTNYEASEIVAASNLVGGDANDLAHFSAMFASLDNALLPESEAIKYADEVAAVVAGYIDGTADPSVVRFDVLQTLICAVKERNDVMKVKATMGPRAVVNSQYDEDFCGRKGAADTSGDFIGAIRPVVVPAIPLCEDWCVDSPIVWIKKCAFDACTGCDACADPAGADSPQCEVRYAAKETDGSMVSGKTWWFYTWGCRAKEDGKCLVDSAACAAEGGAWIANTPTYCGAKALSVICGCCSFKTPTVAPAPAPTTPTFDRSIPWKKGLSGEPKDQTMNVRAGDVLKFGWAGTHNVYQMKDKAAFDSCDFSGSANIGGVSPVYYTMGAATTYFACKVGSHCVSGQKLSAVIGGGTGGSSPTPAPPLTKVAGFPSTLTAGETFSFATPPANTIYTLSVKVTGRDTLLRVARSYGDASWGWEVSAECPVAIVFSAAGPSIVATLPTMSTYGSVTQYFTEAIDGKAAVDSAATKKGAVSRLLVQSTFGPTTTSMGELSSTSTNNMKSWIDAQVRGGRKETWREQGN